jgi:hypothetical protein
MWKFINECLIGTGPWCWIIYLSRFRSKQDF